MSPNESTKMARLVKALGNSLTEVALLMLRSPEAE